MAAAIEIGELAGVTVRSNDVVQRYGEFLLNTVLSDLTNVFAAEPDGVLACMLRANDGVRRVKPLNGDNGDLHPGAGAVIDCA
jgi:hypothetical protein